MRERIRKGEEGRENECEKVLERESKGEKMSETSVGEVDVRENGWVRECIREGEEARENTRIRKNE